MYEHGLIAPVVALLIWSFLVLIWLYATRIPAMQRAKIRPNSATKEEMEGLPASARNVADNYNHLMEQPTLFYAVCFALHFRGHRRGVCGVACGAFAGAGHREHQHAPLLHLRVGQHRAGRLDFPRRARGGAGLVQLAFLAARPDDPPR